VETGEKYTQPDERLAVAYFRQWQEARQQTAVRVHAPWERKKTYGVGHEPLRQAALDYEADGWHISQFVHPSILYGWLREQLLTNAKHVADQVGIPQLASLADMALPRASIKFTSLISAYVEHASVKSITARKVQASWADFVTTTGAKCLRDLTTEVLLAYADAVNARSLAEESKANLFTRVKTVIGYGRARGMSGTEIGQTGSERRCL
jgi:hypothetical protein